MSERPEADERLERLLKRTLSALPPRRAPPTLQSRVLEELQRRAARPWWQGSFAHWPLPARGVFLLLSAVLIDLLLLASRRGAVYLQSLHGAGAWTSSGMRTVAAILDAARALLHTLPQSIPSTWLYEGVGLAAALYALLFGLGAAAYRTLYLER